MEVLANYTDLTKAVLVVDGYDYYLMLEGEDVDTMHEIHTDSNGELYPYENYIYWDDFSVVPYAFNMDEITTEKNIKELEDGLA